LAHRLDIRAWLYLARLVPHTHTQIALAMGALKMKMASFAEPVLENPDLVQRDTAALNQIDFRNRATANESNFIF